MRLKTAVPMMLLLLLGACGAAEDPTAQAPIALRTALTEAGGCQFTLALTADYGDQVRDYTLECHGTAAGPATLKVLEPELARGIEATVQRETAQVCYADTVLAEESFSARPITPMAAPYLLTQAWSGGYIHDAGADGDQLAVTYLLGYGGRELRVNTWLSGLVPVRAEITDGTNTLISCDIQDFTLQKKAEQHESHDTQTDLGGDRP